jgi:hypothetical protein
MRTVTMQEAEREAKERRAAAWLVLAEMLADEDEANPAPLALVGDERVPRLRRPRRSGRGPLAA